MSAKQDSSLVLGFSVILILTIILIWCSCKTTKENLCLCNNLGGSIYKSVDYNPAVYNYAENNPYF